MISIPSFAKINLGLKIGAVRPDGFHELRTIYQTLALHDVVRVDVLPGSGIEIRCTIHLCRWMSRTPAGKSRSRCWERHLSAEAADRVISLRRT
jgi:hypothetical protein